MASTAAATASPDRRVRRQAQAQQHEDEGGGGGIAFLLVAAGLGALGVYELTKSKKLTCPTGYTLTNGQCVQNTTVTPPPTQNTPTQTPPANYPACWCTLDQATQEAYQVFFNMLQRWPDCSDPSYWTDRFNGANGVPCCPYGSGIPNVAYNISGTPEFTGDVMALAGTAPGGGDAIDQVVQACFYRILGRWPTVSYDASWNIWRSYYQSGGVPKLAVAFYAGAEFTARVQSQIAAAVCH